MVHVTYDPRVVDYDTLAKLGRRGAEIAFVRNDDERLAAKRYYDQVRPLEGPLDGKLRRVKDTKYYLQKSRLGKLPLTELQAVRLNADANQAKRWLSPSQLEFLTWIERHPDAGWRPFDRKNVAFASHWVETSTVVQRLEKRQSEGGSDR